MEKETVIITLEKYKRLLKAEMTMNMLYGGGVDNWEGYGESLNPDNEDSIDDIKEKIDKADYSDIIVEV